MYKEVLKSIYDALRRLFDDVYVTGIYIMPRVFGDILRPEEAASRAEAASSMFLTAAVFTDDLGFLNMMGLLAISRVRGSLAIAVFDIHDIRPICHELGLPVLEPWDVKSLEEALRECREYSEVFEVPYVIRIGPWIKEQASIEAETRKRSPTFNKNWNEPLNWGLNRFFTRLRRELKPELLKRCENFVSYEGDGDVVIVSGSAWRYAAGELRSFKVMKSLYVNPLPKAEAKYSADVGDYLSRILNLQPLFTDRIQARFESDIRALYEEFFLRETPDLTSLAEYVVFMKRRECEVPLLFCDVTIAMAPKKINMRKSLDVLPTWFEPQSLDEVLDFVGLQHAALTLATHYQYGPVYAILNAKYVDKGLLKSLILKGARPIVIGDLDVNELPCEILEYDHDNPLSVLHALRKDFQCLVIKEKGRKVGVRIWPEYCDLCGECLLLGCSAIRIVKRVLIDDDKCTKCGLCVLTCRRGALTRSP